MINECYVQERSVDGRDSLLFGAADPYSPNGMVEQGLLLKST